MRTCARAVVAMLVMFSPLGSAAAQDFGLADLAALRPRNIGPAGMSGRIAAIDALTSDPNLIWVGAATGGAWKSVNGGTTWTPMFDRERVSGVGSIAIDQNRPDVVWVGTGEGNPRNSAGVGAGLYKTTDGGRSWRLLGLEASERIHRIILHPQDPETAWVGVMGPAWSDGEERGVYKTTDGGETWARVLWINQRTGVSDLVIDPSNPNKLYAAMWEFRREAWSLTSGGPGSGLHISEDGGETWERYGAERGLPEGDLGRIGLSVSAGDPTVVYALVEARRSALLRSPDGGASWVTLNEDPNVATRPFYYTDIFVDPEIDSRVYNLNSRLWISENGGRSFDQAHVDVHSDMHALWIDPNDARHMLLGTDGGLWESRDRASTWTGLDNLPVGQFYHVSVDDAVPYNVYGGMQDNGSWRGPSDVWEVGGIRNSHWKEIAFGDGFRALPDPTDPNFGYAMSQGGRLVRFDVRTGERKDIRPWAPDTVTLRFNWNAAIAFDPFEQGTVYLGSQFVHRTDDRGHTWQIISRDLTTNDPAKQRQGESGGLTIDNTGAENHTTLLSIAPSPVTPEAIWTGSDDGKIQLTRSGGGSWQDLTSKLTGIPANTWIPHIEASRHDSATAYVVMDDHRRGNWEPYLFRTRDWGNRWENIGRGRGLDGFLHTMIEDPVAPNLLFAGGELGLFVSLDRGGQWFKWTHGFPTVPVRSLVIHPRDHDLVIGTHGRAIWILDDIRALRELALNPLLARDPVHLFDMPPAFTRYTAAVDGYHFSGDSRFRGETRLEGALLTYWVSEAVDSVRISVVDFEGSTVRTMWGPANRGLNRVAWDLREDLAVGIEVPRGAGIEGAQAVPGDYSVTVSVEGSEATRRLTVLPDPRVEIGLAERIERHKAVVASIRIQARIARLSASGDEVRRGVDQTRGLLAGREDAVAESLREAGTQLLEALGPVVDASGLGRYDRRLRGMSSSYDRPTEAQRVDMRRADELLVPLEANLRAFMEGPVAAFRDRLIGEGLVAFPVPARIGR